MVQFIMHSLENIVGKQENVGCQHLLFSNNVFKRSVNRVIKTGGCVVKGLDNSLILHHSNFKSLAGDNINHTEISEIVNSFPIDKFKPLPNQKSLQTTISILVKMGRKHCGEKEKLLVTSNFSFSHSVFKRLVVQTRKNRGLFGKGLIDKKNSEKMPLTFFFFSNNVFETLLWHSRINSSL